MGHPLSPPSLVRLPHRTRIKHNFSSPSHLHSRFLQHHHPLPRTRILLLHLPQQRKTRTPSFPPNTYITLDCPYVRYHRSNTPPRRHSGYYTPTCLQPQTSRTITHRSFRFFPHRAIPPSRTLPP